mmetsp:Transcript_21187/g.35053  ORF Transcript_21187/g.35053 Transcript_21187/m.35053 type:complete len:214 (-) Transcript_21187:3327-3968(-)
MERTLVHVPIGVHTQARSLCLVIEPSAVIERHRSGSVGHLSLSILASCLPHAFVLVPIAILQYAQPLGPAAVPLSNIFGPIGVQEGAVALELVSNKAACVLAAILCKYHRAPPLQPIHLPLPLIATCRPLADAHAMALAAVPFAHIGVASIARVGEGALAVEHVLLPAALVRASIPVRHRAHPVMFVVLPSTIILPSILVSHFANARLFVVRK